MQERKNLKAEIKKDMAILHTATKDTIEKLSDVEANMLLEKKWIDGLMINLFDMPEKIVDDLVSKIQALCDKYATTYFEVEEQIKETEKALCSILDELEGNEFDMKGLSEFKSLLMGE